MRTSAIIRIVTYSIITIALTMFLIANINGFHGGFKNLFRFNNIGSRIETSVNENRIDESNNGTPIDTVANSVQLNAQEVTKININWVAGDITVIPYNGDKIIVTEFPSQYIEDKYKMVATLKNGKLTVDYMRNAVNINIGIGFNNFEAKPLEIKIPISHYLDNFDIEAVSSDINISNINVNTIDLTTVSGEIEGSNLTAKDFSTNSVSGKVNIDGAFNNISHNSVSGRANIITNILPHELDFETVSGNGTITIPENDGFTVDYDKVSGHVNCDFPTTSSKNKIVYKNGEANFDIETVSGNIKICKK